MGTFGSLRTYQDHDEGDAEVDGTDVGALPFTGSIRQLQMEEKLTIDSSVDKEFYIFSRRVHH